MHNGRMVNVVEQVWCIMSVDPSLAVVEGQDGTLLDDRGKRQRSGGTPVAEAFRLSLSNLGVSLTVAGGVPEIAAKPC